jgi:hypothetical protein
LHTTSPVFNISFSKEISNASNVLDSPLSSIDLVPKEKFGVLPKDYKG